ncbi:unnamed protein product [Pieris brassicae]|uniref:Peptidase A2 domain-containing protein n=1 Tax=Pieris brassicae TaxID=7116 RepID=A0A9P0TJN2_PIEBR|nr:unnamed protein product [Pieris brassicae]
MSRIVFHKVHTTSKDFSEVLLATAKIKVLEVNGKPYLMRALIDQGSQISIISEKAAQLLKLKREGCNGIISGVGENTQRIKGQVTLTCTSIHTNYTLKTRVFIMNNLVHKLSNNSFNMPSWLYIKDIELADPEFNRSSQVDILFGADDYAQIMMNGILRGENLSQPIAQQTRFGWILCGKLKLYQCNIILNNTEDLQKFWEIEVIEESPSVMSSENQYCRELYKKTTLRQANGRYKVRLPLKNNLKESLGWYRGEKRSIKFAIPRIWREPKDHTTDCYFCMVNPSKRRRGKNAKPIEYPDLESSSAPIAHDLTRPVPEPPKKISQKSSSSFSSYKSNSDKEFLPTPEQPKHYLITSEDFNDLIRDLNLPKN